ncbi:Retrovirus-related Pol polyprotein, partial [Mucuna pruriens]
MLLSDLYPLPNINRLVDGASGFTLLSFMDTYLLRIRMYLYNEPKTTFIIDSGTFCYKVMPFGLKNIGVTYQRLMDRIFKDVMGTNVETYIDDMVVKSTMANEHYNALQRVFEILRKHQLKLNLEKCSFGV